MKTMKYAFYTSLVCGAIIGAAQAQDTKPAAPMTSSRPIFMTNTMPPGMAGRTMPDRTEMLARMLKLSDEQKAKVKPIIDEETKQMDEIRQKTMEKLKPILTDEQYAQYSRFGGMRPGMMPPRGAGGPPNVPSTPPPGATPSTPTTPTTPAK